MADSDRFWRIYKTEWCVAYVSDTDGSEGKRECVKWYQEQYTGRVREDDWGLEAWSGNLPDSWPWMLMLRLPVMKGEYTGRPAALAYASEIKGLVVLEGSKADLKLLSYGKKMMREGSVDSQSVGETAPACGAES
jgi:hypothetical protein